MPDEADLTPEMIETILGQLTNSESTQAPSTNVETTTSNNTSAFYGISPVWRPSYQETQEASLRLDELIGNSSAPWNTEIVSVPIFDFDEDSREYKIEKQLYPNRFVVIDEKQADKPKS